MDEMDSFLLFSLQSIHIAMLIGSNKAVTNLIHNICSKIKKYHQQLLIFTYNICSYLSLFNRDYITYMLTLVLLYLMFPAVTMWSCYDAINKHFKKIHHYRVNVLQWSQNPF